MCISPPMRIYAYRFMYVRVYMYASIISYTSTRTRTPFACARALYPSSSSSSFLYVSFFLSFLPLSLFWLQSLMYYSPSRGITLYFRITLALPAWIAPVRSLIERGISIDDGGGRKLALSQTTYESNIPFILRYLVDSKTTGCSWIVGKNRRKREKERGGPAED